MHATQTSPGRSVCGSFSCRTTTGGVMSTPVAKPATVRETERLRRVTQLASASRWSRSTFQSTSGTQLRAIPAKKV